MDKLNVAKEIRNAIKRGDYDRVKDLLDANHNMLKWITPFGSWLHIASAHGKKEIVTYLVESGLDVNIKGGTFATGAIERAATKGHIEIVKYLLNKNAEIDVSEPDKNPLFAAIYGGHKQIVKLLVEHGTDITVKYTGESMKAMDAYSFALERGQIEIAEYLKQRIEEHK